MLRGTMGVAVPVAEKPFRVIVRGVTDVVAPDAENPPSVIVRGTMGTAVPLARKPVRGIVRGPELVELLDIACLGPTSLAGAGVGAVMVIMPGVTL